MRLFPPLWTGPARLNWVMVGMELLGLDNLGQVPSLLSGFRAIEGVAALEPHQRVLQNLRHLTLDLATLAGLRSAVERYLEHHQENDDALFELDPETLAFHAPTSLFEPPQLASARDVLLSSVPLRPRTRVVADPGREMGVRLSPDSLPLVVSPLGFVPPPTPRHDLSRASKNKLTIPWVSLLDEAREMDEMDARSPERRPGNWHAILSRASLLKAADDAGLVREKTLRLDGLHHLIGLPGSGKTTLLIVLARWLARRGHRIALFFPSIEVCRQRLVVLEQYGVSVGLLVGQSPLTRRRHMDRLAEAIGAGPDHGFGVTLPGADRFGANCVLGGYARDGAGPWPFGEAPCESVLQTTNKQAGRHLCPLWSLCGRNLAPRQLVHAQVWLGHVFSMDTEVPAATSDRRLTYYELIARTFDLVVFDEADGVQKALDGYGATELDLSGTASSMHRVVAEEIHTRFARGDNSRLRDSEVNIYARELAEFGNQSNNLMHLLHNIGRAATLHERRLLTPARILAELIWRGHDDADDQTRRDIDSKLREVLSDWERASKAAMGTRDQADEPDEPNVWTRRLGRLLRQHLAAIYSRSRKEIDSQIVEMLAERALGRRPTRTEEEEFLLLLHVTFVIRSYQRVVPGTRTMVAEGLLRETTVNSKVSAALRRYCPESLLGHLSGVRYEFQGESRSSRTGAKNIRLKYVSFAASPRVLMARMHDLLKPEGGPTGPSVLLTSATSFLEASPAHHIHDGEITVLRAQETEPAAVESRFVFKPIPDPKRPGRHLRFSGAGSGREANLLAMVDHLLGRGRDRSEVAKAIRHFDVESGVPRKAALVVNSYAQAQRIKEYVDRVYPEVGRRVRSLVRAVPENGRDTGYLTTSQVGALGDDPGWDVLVFPLGALGRGTNVVFSSGPRRRHATIGSIWFLTRPHPPAGDLGFLHGLAGRASQAFDAATLPDDLSVDGVARALRSERRRIYETAQRLLREPLMASRLGHLFRPFTADLMVDILQTIGRGMRGSRPVQVFFTDVAWAPSSADEKPEEPGSSMLAEMISILADCVGHEDPIRRAIYGELYLPFLRPLAAMEGLLLPDELRGRLAALEL